jgi:hypothetical protein
MDSVEIYNCSQFDTYKAAVRFEGAEGAWNSISNSALHHGLGIGLVIHSSANVIFANNDVFDFVRFGIDIEVSQNITIDNNWVHGIFSRHLSAMDIADPVGGILGCAHQDRDKCKAVRITNNVVSTIEFSGVDSFCYSVMGHQCGNYRDIVFKDNVAHSSAGYGAIIFRNESRVGGYE